LNVVSLFFYESFFKLSKIILKKYPQKMTATNALFFRASPKRVHFFKENKFIHNIQWIDFKNNVLGRVF